MLAVLQVAQAIKTFLVSKEATIAIDHSGRTTARFMAEPGYDSIIVQVINPIAASIVAWESTATEVELRIPIKDMDRIAQDWLAYRNKGDGV